MDGIPDGKEAYSENRQEDDDDIEGMDADGIGVDYKRTLAATQRDDAVGLLNPTEQQAKGDTYNGANS